MADEKIKIDISKLPTAKEYATQLEGTWLPFLTALDTSFDEMGNQVHKYVSQHTGEIGAEIAKGISASVTQAISMAMGNAMPDISKITKKDIAILESKKGKTEQEKFIVNLYNASKRGTAVHKLMEEQEARGVGVGELQKLLRERKFDAQTMEIFDDFFSKDSIRAAQQFKNLFETVGQILQIKEISGLKNTKFSETALGATTIIGGKRVNITGTIDQIIDNALNDFKTGATTGIKEALQQTIYLALGQINKDLIPGVGNISRSYLTHVPKSGNAQLLELLGATPEVTNQIMRAVATSVATGERSNLNFKNLGLEWKPVQTRAKISHKDFYIGAQYTGNQAFNQEMRDYEGMFWDKYGKEIQGIIDLPETERTSEQIQRINELFGQFADTVNRLKKSPGQRIASDWWENQLPLITQIAQGDTSAIGQLSLVPEVQKASGIAINDRFISSYFKEWKTKGTDGKEVIKSNVNELISLAKQDPSVASAVSEWIVNQMIQELFDNEDWTTLFSPENLTAYLSEQIKAGSLQGAKAQFVSSVFGAHGANELSAAFQRRNKRYQESPAGQRWKQRWNYQFGTEREYLDIPKEEIHRNLSNLRDFEEKDWWESEAQWQDTLLERGSERKSLGYEDKPIQGEQAATQLADRFTRLVDFYQRVNNIFKNLANQLNAELSEGEPEYTAEELARGYLANLPEPDTYSRYMRSKELYEEYMGSQSDKSIEEQIKWLYEKLDLYSAEEGNIQYLMNEMKRIGLTEDVKSFQAEFARKMSYVGKPSTHIAPNTLAGILTGATFGAREESSYFDKYNYQRILDASGREDLKKDIETIAKEDEIGELDFYIKTLTREASELGATKKQLASVVKWLTSLSSISEKISKEAKLDVPLGLDETLDAALALESGTRLDETVLGDIVEKSGQPFGGFTAMPKGKGANALISRLKTIREDYEQYEDEMETAKQIQVGDALEKQKQFQHRYLDVVRNAEGFLKELQGPISDPWDALGGTPVPEYVGPETTIPTIHIGEATVKAEDVAVDTQGAQISTDDGTTINTNNAAGAINVGTNGASIDFNGRDIPKVQPASNVPMPDDLDKRSKVTVIGALLEETKGIHADTTGIKNALSSFSGSDGGGGGPQYLLEQKVANAFSGVEYKSETDAKQRGSSSDADGLSTEDFKAYIELMKEQYALYEKIASVMKQIDILKRKGGDTFSLEAQKRELQDILEARQEEMAVYAQGGLSGKQQARVSAMQKEAETKLAYRTSLFGFAFDEGKTGGVSRVTTQDQIAAEKQYQSLYEKRLSMEKQIMSARHQIAISYSPKEKTALQNIILLLQKKIDLGDQEAQILEKSGLVRAEQLQSILEEYNANLQLASAQEAGKKQGASNLWDVMANDIRRATMRVADFGIAAKILSKIPQDIQKIVQYAKQLDAALVNLRIASGLNKEEGEALILTYNKLAKSLSATTQEVADAGDAWLRQGYTVESTTKLIEASLKLSKLGQIQSAEATKALTAALKGFKLEASEAMDVVDKLTKVDMAAAVSAGDIAEGLSRVSTSAQLAGLDMDKTIGILSTIGEVTQRDLGSVGDSLRTLLSRYGNVKAGVFTQMGLDDDGETTENINDIEKVLRQLGISIRTTSLEMRSVDEVLDELASKWSTLDTVTKNAIATAFAGVRQRENFLVLMENWERANELAEESASSAGTAAEKYKIYEDSVEAATKKLEAAWENLSQEFKASDIVKGGTKFLTFFVENLGLITRMIVTLIATVNSSKISDFMANTVMKAGTGIKGLFTGGLFKGGIFGTGGRVLTYDEQGNPVFGKQSENTGWNKAATKIVGAITGINGVIKPIEEIRDAVMGKSSASGTKKGIATLGEKDISLFSKKELERMSAEEKQQASTQQVYKHGFTGVTGEKIDGERIYYKGGYAYTSKGRVMADRTIEPFMTQAPSNIIRDPESGKLRYVDQSGNVVTNKLGIPKAVSKLDKEAFQTYESDMALSQEAAQASKAYGTMAAFAKIQQVSTAGISAYVGQQLSNRDVGTGLAADWYNKTGQTVEETDADKQGRVWGTTATTMIGTALLGEAGSAIGQVVGEELFGYFNYLAHEEELVQKQESAEAAENLEALNKIESHTKSIENRVKTSMLSSEDYQELLNYMDAVRQNVSSMSSSQMAKYLEDLGEAIGASGSDYITVMNKLQSNLLDGDKATRENTLQQMKVVTAQQELEETIDSQKSKRKEITGSDTVEIDAPTWMKITNYATQIGAQAAIAGGLGAAGGSAFGPLGTVAGLGAGLASGTISGIATAAGMNAALDELYHDYVFTGTPEERLRQAKEQREKVEADDDATESYRKRVLEKLDEYIATQTQQVVELANMDKEIIQKRVNVGLTAANLAQYTDDELSGLTMEGAINKVADAMENQGVKVRNVAGIIKNEYLPSIKAAIRSDAALSALTKGDAKTIGELFEAPTKLSESLAKANINQTYESLRKLLDESTPQNKGMFNSIAAALGYSVDNLTALVYAADPERIEQFGNAWNLPIDKVQELKDKFNTLTAAEGLMSPSEVREKYGKYSDILEKISGTTSYDRETYERILSNYPELYQYLREGQGSLYGALSNMIGEQQQLAYGHALFTEELDNKEIAADFKKRMQEGGFKDIFGDLELDTAIFGDADSIQKILTQAALLGGEMGQKIQDAVKKYMNWDRIIKIDNPQLTQAIEAQKQKLDEQLDNLKEQKEALDDINNQRKYEIELIKAKAQLEDARKDKKRVYREGVGFVYQADEDAVGKAQEKIDELNVDMQKEELQVQIDQLTVEKSILDNLEKSEQLAQLQEGLDQWQNKQTDAIGGLTALLAQAYQNQGVEFNFGEGDWIQDWINNTLEQRTKKLEKAETARTKYESALAEVQQAEASGRTSKEFQQKAALFQVAAKAYQEARDAVSDAKKEELKKYGLDTIQQKDINEATKKYKPSDAIALDKNKYSVEGLSSNARENDDVDITVTIDGEKKIYDLSSGKITSDTIATDLTAAYKGKYNKEPEAGSLVYLGGLVYMYDKKGNWRLPKNDMDDADVMFSEVGSETQREGYASGTLSANSGLSLINELGTEGIITPSGTLTALPSKTGVVPADITRNVWQLGEVAPTLIAQLDSLVRQKAFVGAPQSVVNEEGQYIDHLTMNVYPTKDYDMDALLAEARTKVKLTKHNN